MMFRDPAVTARVVEWLELLRILGAGKVFLYYYALPRKLKQALDMYQEDGLVELTKWALVGKLPSR